MNLCD